MESKIRRSFVIILMAGLTIIIHNVFDAERRINNLVIYSEIIKGSLVFFNRE